MSETEARPALTLESLIGAARSADARPSAEDAGGGSRRPAASFDLAAALGYEAAPPAGAPVAEGGSDRRDPEPFDLARALGYASGFDPTADARGRAFADAAVPPTSGSESTSTVGAAGRGRAPVRGKYADAGKVAPARRPARTEPWPGPTSAPAAAGEPVSREDAATREGGARPRRAELLAAGPPAEGSAGASRAVARGENPSDRGRARTGGALAVRDQSGGDALLLLLSQGPGRGGLARSSSDEADRRDAQSPADAGAAPDATAPASCAERLTEACASVSDEGAGDRAVPSPSRVAEGIDVPEPSRAPAPAVSSGAPARRATPPRRPAVARSDGRARARGVGMLALATALLALAVACAVAAFGGLDALAVAVAALPSTSLAS